MRKILSELFLTPESQKIPHYKAAVYLAHAWLSFGGIIFLTPYLGVWIATILISFGYLAVWEGLQYAFYKNKTKRLIWDCIADGTAISFGAFTAAFFASNQNFLAMICWLSTLVVAGMSWRKKIIVNP